jgi:Zn-dependent protease with chaperone function
VTGKFRWLALGVLLAAGAALAIAFYLERVKTPLDSSLAPAFQLLGTPVKAVDSLVGRVVPVGEVEERDLGLVLRTRYEAQANAADPDFVYVNDLLEQVAASASREFDYRAYVLEDQAPNAMALPGGVVLVTRGLLANLGSEAEVTSVLAHEVGHIDQGHCFDAVKFQLLTRKIGNTALGGIADIAVQVLLRHSFSKTQEDEADEYAYTLLLHGPYDPRGVGQSFASMIAFVRGGGPASGARTRANPIRDYFMSHPPLELREAKFREKAGAWWRGHPDERRYVGKRNLKERKSLHSGAVHAAERVGAQSAGAARAG